LEVVQHSILGVLEAALQPAIKEERFVELKQLLHIYLLIDQQTAFYQVCFFIVLHN
jgi:hypothetical protein